VAWLTLCVVWSSTWLAIKIGLRDLPPISFVAIRFLIAIIVLVAVSIGRTHLLPRTRNDYIVLAVTGFSCSRELHAAVLGGAARFVRSCCSAAGKHSNFRHDVRPLDAAG
jgi:hypothetical protein